MMLTVRDEQSPASVAYGGAFVRGFFIERTVGGTSILNLGRPGGLLLLKKGGEALVNGGPHWGAASISRY